MRAKLTFHLTIAPCLLPRGRADRLRQKDRQTKRKNTLPVPQNLLPAKRKTRSNQKETPGTQMRRILKSKKDSLSPEAVFFSSEEKKFSSEVEIFSSEEDFFSSDLKFPTPRCGIFHRATRISAPRSGQCPTANDAFWGGAGSLREFIPLFSSKFVSLLR